MSGSSREEKASANASSENLATDLRPLQATAETQPTNRRSSVREQVRQLVGDEQADRHRERWRRSRLHRQAQQIVPPATTRTRHPTGKIDRAAAVAQLGGLLGRELFAQLRVAEHFRHAFCVTLRIDRPPASLSALVRHDNVFLWPSGVVGDHTCSRKHLAVSGLVLCLSRACLGT
jgi:hypothetical protein